jgi:hypothetical protein
MPVGMPCVYVRMNNLAKPNQGVHERYKLPSNRSKLVSVLTGRGVLRGAIRVSSSRPRHAWVVLAWPEFHVTYDVRWGVPKPGSENLSHGFMQALTGL